MAGCQAGRPLSDRPALDTTNQIRDASSRAHLVPIATRRLQMQIPDDSQVVILVRPATPDRLGDTVPSRLASLP